MTAAGEAERMAALCLRRAALPASLATLALLAIAAWHPPVDLHLLHAAFGILATTLALVTLGYSVLIGFDALLFRLIAGYEEVPDGCVAVDDLLARMRLKQRPATIRPLAARIAGTRRLMQHQQIALGACLVVTAAALLS
jgi:hypothetical protein